MSKIAGVDEAGRGPLAGPVTAAAVILNPRLPIHGLADSKKLTAIQRERLEKEIRQNCDWAIGWASVEEIDSCNILQATFFAMRRAVALLQHSPSLVLVDGNQTPDFGISARAIIGGDARVAAISAASILAKTARDALMRRWHHLYPAYGFASNKGYPTQAHRRAIEQHGLTPLHRKTFAYKPA